jgi:hypothetical protein
MILVRFAADSVAKLDRFLKLGWAVNFGHSFAPLSHLRESRAATPDTTRLGRASCCQWRGTAEELGKPPQILSRCGEQHLVPGAVQAAQPKPIEFEDSRFI